MSDGSDEVDELTAAARTAALAYLNIAVALARKATNQTPRAAHSGATTSPTTRTTSPTSTPEPGTARPSSLTPTPAKQTQSPSAPVEQHAKADRSSNRYAPLLVEVLEPTLTQAVLADPGWPALAARLATAEREGADPKTLLAQAAAQREMTSARRPALLLAHRLQHLDAQYPSQDADQQPDQHPDQQTHHQRPSRGEPDAAQRPGPARAGVSSAVARTYPQPLGPASAPAVASAGPTETSGPSARAARGSAVADVLARTYPTPVGITSPAEGGRRRLRQSGTLRPQTSTLAASRRSWVLLLPTRSSRRGGS